MRIPSRLVEHAIGLTLALGGFILYVLTLCPTTDFIDAGELSTVAYTLGIAHPTGYPLFTLVGWMFSHLPLFGPVVYRLNLMAAFLCAVSLFIFFRFLLYLSSEFLPPRAGSDTGLVRYSSAAAGTITLACSETFWSQAVAVEVYSLHAVFLSLLLLLFLRAIRAEGDGESSAQRPRRWYVFAFVLGLSFTNHMTTILLAPAFLVLYFIVLGRGPNAWKLLLRMALPFVLGLSVYLYLPLRASQHPLLNWGNPVELERFWWHFTGKQYRVWIFSSSESAMKQLSYFLTTVTPEFGYAAIIPAAVGMWSLVKRQKRLALFTALLFVGCIGYAINYDIHDIDSYFLLAYFTIAIWCAIGVSEIILYLRSGESRKLVAAGIVLVLAATGMSNYRNNDESDLRLVEQYTKSMFDSVRPNGLIISYQWDYFVSAAYYFQIVEHYRPDVIVVDKELLRRSWYYAQLRNRYPELYRSSAREIDAFLVELSKFEHDLPYDPGVIEMRYNAVIRSLLDRNYEKRPVYATGEVEEQYTRGYLRVPSGMAFRLYREGGYHDEGIPSFTFTVPRRQERLVDGLIQQYSRAYLNHSIYKHLWGKDSVAVEMVKRALEIDPSMPEALGLREELERGR